MEKIHRKTLRIIHHSNASYRDLLKSDGSMSVHQRHLGILLTEIYKSAHLLNPDLRGTSSEKAPYNTRKAVLILLPPARSHGRHFTHFRCTLIRNQVQLGNIEILGGKFFSL